MLQRAFEEEFKSELEQRRAKRREQLRKDAQQRGLRQRRLDMERSLQEEQDELARNHQIGMMIDMIKENMMGTSLRINVTSVSARSLAKAMWINDTITCLDLSSNDLSDHAGCYLARILKRNSTLKKLELDNNRLGVKACAAFGECLSANTSLVYLSLDSNPIASESDLSGLTSLANALKMNKTITSLNLWRTNIPEAGGNILASALEVNETLLFCDTGHNFIEIGDVKKITDKLDANLAQFEANERVRRRHEEVRGQQRQREEEDESQRSKEVELKKWLEERRDHRSENLRLNEEMRIQRLQEEAEERKRLLEQRLAEEKKAAEEAAAKKAKKKNDKKK
ncbi:hypothetical protein EON64_06400 [archaeon]|nr:MAG: hypothetical protein EON64_06400 [archaeon]